MTTREIRSVLRGVRFTPTEDALMLKQAQAEGYPSVTEWLRDTALKAARGRDLIREEVERIAEEAGKGYLNLGEQISAGTARQIQAGIDKIGASVDQRIEGAVQAAARLAVNAAMRDVLMSQEVFRKEIADNMQALLNTVMGVDPGTAGGQTDTTQQGSTGGGGDLVNDMIRAGRAAAGRAGRP
ncbi:hypothetical protein [Burkholderia anthina]|uniref:hypothetical protein n=1 Tax=Burkholderia anthina TaxID=179879 RepID=UPI0037BEF2E2